ncbi:MAG: hypothetical protein A2845_04425 [Candidatus Lloydbacteria bacterium RIFCSPHIGHO2_01_FULL_49_22]|uniref:Uncharacterized protein n=1 Tax=Candidatus Lloydbacteria bacterium RIFCSPHIGHO2_01_FULL_49_22 TaxID=1798658 RepID=A0A1G2CWC5_9BACT|nr:MAG: hypothetical protein A2845_04425 [Candidatus Lloydbacteria bacterium RIFCSPHIGHO2_01_FULL_49_22]OGZ08896.1 MAG: hypothetical protein A3C14_01460 [Candidatus Lloydbacteria bacterium RIFCSPHIGHO2_02_FULL_50_18]
MKRIVAITILLGYVTLVPFCFFGGMLSAQVSTMEMDMDVGPVHQVSDCGMSISGCVQSMDTGAIGSMMNHVGMYLSLSQTPLLTLSLMTVIIALFLLVATGLIDAYLRAFLARVFVHLRARRADEPRNRIRQSILNWLSLFETSPNFA